MTPFPKSPKVKSSFPLTNKARDYLSIKQYGGKSTPTGGMSTQAYPTKSASYKSSSNKPPFSGSPITGQISGAHVPPKTVTRYGLPITYGGASGQINVPLESEQLHTRTIHSVPTEAEQEIDYDSFLTEIDIARGMEDLGYDATYQDGGFVFEKQQYSQPTTLSPYGQYGMSNQPFIYETDWLMTKQRQGYQQTPYTPGYRQYGTQGNYQPSYYNGYYQKYYSNYGQRYNDYGYYPRNGYNQDRWYKQRKWRRNYANRYNSRSSGRNLRSW